MSDRLQNFIQLNELAENIHATGRRVAIVLEGRDGAGKSGTVREITRYMPPYAYRVQPSHAIKAYDEILVARMEKAASEKRADGYL